MLLLGTFLNAAPTLSQEYDQQALNTQSKVVIKQLATELKATLSSKMKSDGPIAALEVCQLQAPQITTKVSDSNNIQIRRTSSKVRNSNNAPDNWEQMILASFQKQKEAGAEIKTLEHGEIIEENGQKYYRFMKAIPTQAVCMKCHGSQIEPNLQKKINALYPNDKAVGFSKGDIRGAFTVKTPLTFK